MKKYAERVWLIQWNFVSEEGRVINLQDATSGDDSCIADWETFYVLNDNHSHEDIPAQEAINLAIDEFCKQKNLQRDAHFHEDECGIY